MNGWTLDYLRSLDVDDYNTLVAMVIDEQERLAALQDS